VEKPNAVGDGGLAYGIAQWHPGRQKHFADYAQEKHWANHNIHGATLNEQLGFVNWELTQGSEKHAGEKLRATENAKEAGEAVCRYYERPAHLEEQYLKRGKLAQEIA